MESWRLDSLRGGAGRQRLDVVVRDSEPGEPLVLSVQLAEVLQSRGRYASVRQAQFSLIDASRATGSGRAASAGELQLLRARGLCNPKTTKGRLLAAAEGGHVLAVIGGSVPEALAAELRALQQDLQRRKVGNF